MGHQGGRCGKSGWRVAEGKGAIPEFPGSRVAGQRAGSPDLCTMPPEHHAAVGRHVPERAQEPGPTVPAAARGADADAYLVEPHAQPLPAGGDAASWRATGLGRAVPGAADHDGPAHP